MTRDFVNIMQDVGDTGSCGSCKKLATAPCYLLACKLSASSSTVNLATFSINVPLSGSTVFKICDASVIQGSAVGALYVLTSPGRILAPAPVGSIATACVKTISAEGIIQCGAGAQKTNYTTCLDHNTGGASNIAGATTSGDCAGDVCQGSVANNDPSETPGIINGGTCVDITNVSGTAGDAFINLTSQIGLAPLGDSCTNPDTLTSPGTPELTALTTGSPLATVKDADDAAGSEITSDPQTGSVFNCATLGAGQSAGTKLVGAYPSVNSLEPAPDTLLDSAIGFTLQCE
jgi:hypothetical protein